MKKNSALVLGASSDKLFAIGAFIISLLKKNPSFTDDIIVFYDKITDEERRKFASFKNVILKEYCCPFANAPGLSYFTKDLFTLMVYTKYECIRLLDEYRTVIWMDYDMFVLDDISELLVPVREGVRAIVTEKIEDSLVEGAKIHTGRQINGIHSSVFALYDNLKDYKKIYEYCLKKTVEMTDILKCPEQAILALAFSEFDVAVYPLDFRIYSNLLSEESIYTRYVKIYHTYGKNKFWNTINYEPWNECLREWEAI